MRVVLTIVALLLLSILALQCKKKENPPPNAITLHPKTNSKVVEGRSIKITAINSEEDYKGQYIFLIDAIEVANFDEGPYEIYWDTEGYEIGVHVIKAEATDFSGLKTEAEINIEIVTYVPATVLTDSRDGNTYDLVEIGEQVWMMENLRYKNEYSASANDHPDLDAEYGLLYRTHIASGEGVCPEEWHLPSQADWNKLIEHLGGWAVAGGKLKETGTQRWAFPNQGASNESGFSARPAGSLTWDSIPEAFGKSARFFTSFYGNYIFIDYDSEDVISHFRHPANEHFSIRCIRDY